MKNSTKQKIITFIKKVLKYQDCNLQTDKPHSIAFDNNKVIPFMAEITVSNIEGFEHIKERLALEMALEFLKANCISFIVKKDDLGRF